MASASLSQDGFQSEGFWEVGLLLLLRSSLLNPSGYFSVATPYSLLRPPVVRQLRQVVIMCLAKAVVSVSGPRRGPPSCNNWLVGSLLCYDWHPDPQGSACLLMGRTQQPALGPFKCPWSPPDVDDWPELPDQVKNERLHWPVFPSLSLSSYPILLVLDAGV